MTKTSFAWFLQFLNNYSYELKPSFKVADYGGSEKIGAEMMRDALSSGGLTNYTILDYESGVDLLKPVPKKYGKFDLGISMDLLEHVTNPFLVAENIKASLKKDALLFVTAPHIWEEHNHPGDYWRFMPQGFKELFKDMEELQLGVVRDQHKEESVPRSRIVGIFRKT